jgi:hypothetical protein
LASPIYQIASLRESGDDDDGGGGGGDDDDDIPLSHYVRKTAVLGHVPLSANLSFFKSNC